MKQKLTLSALAIAIASTSTAFAAEQATTFEEAMTGGEASLSFRYRYEFVDQDGFNKDTNSSTLKTRLNYKTQQYQNATAFIEFDNNTEVLSGYSFGDAGKPTVADPKYTEVNQAYVDYAAPIDTLVRFGRQRINLDNQRFVGGVAWRQNEQTYDAFTLVNTAIPDTTVILTNITNVNNILGDNINGENHQVLNIHNKSLPFGSFSAYAYLLEDISDTYGARFAGKTDLDSLSLLYTLEYATQETDNAASKEADYYIAEFGADIEGITAKVGYEVLASDDGTYGFSTPLATKHKFNGWADKFLATPDDGLEDLYLTVSTKLAGPSIALTYHKFDANEGSTDYGDEIDLAISQDFADRYNVLLKGAAYSQGDTGTPTDTTKVWLQLSAKF
ncbi:alginate export family protein [Alkalimarinus alittae]|uniref:Alginate export family protein n=1 Tax=Alkalimarinus alittae TaxID=2961619 RepID=A0ABY6N0T2_9ALTE|nr:alginate export family protein [Alkalimarinus alittae]UZE95705.1 alginate export family protein [Alkalimarinus alittae]